MKRLFTYPYIVWLGLFVVAPILLVIFYAFSGTDAYGNTYFTFGNLTKFFEGIIEGQPFFQRIYIRVTMRSLRMALQTTLICFALGYPLALILASKGFRNKPFLLFLFIMPMWMNFLVRTYGWMTILERNGVLNNLLRLLRLPTIDILFTDTAVLLGMVYNFLPFMVLPIYTALTRMDKRIIEAAQDLGAGPVNVFVRIIFPLSMPGVVSGITMVFMPAAATFIIPNLLGGGQFFLLGNLVEQQFILVGNWHFGSIIAVIMMFLMVVSTFILSRFDKQEDTSEGGMRL